MCIIESSTRLAECDELEALLDTTLVGLAELFDYAHSMILLADEPAKHLYTVASHGFAQSGIGAEVAIGEGLIGAAALERRPVRVDNMRIEEMYSSAVRTTARERKGSADGQREIPLPGLAGTQSQIAVPMLARDRTLGVLCVQTTEPGRFKMADEQALSTLARYLSTSIQLLGHGTLSDAPAGRVYATRPAGDNAIKIRYHASDDSIFIDDEYLIKGLPGRILLRLLSMYERDGRVDFTTKELRLAESLQLSGYRDNLDARLILLRRRLEERSEAVRLMKTGRGRFRLELKRAFALLHAQ
jgi:adenylate cyclase